MKLDAEVEVTWPSLTVNALVEADPDSRLVIVGPNGSGKSTVIAALAGLAPLRSGHVRLGERTLSDAASGVMTAPRDRRMGVVFQAPNLFPNMSVLDNVAFGPRAQGVPKALARDRARSEVDRVGLGNRAEARPSELSGGEAQRCALARALAVEPQALLLDEPFAALDATARVDVRRAVSDVLSEAAMPVVIVTHDPIEAMVLGDRIVVMEDGHVAQTGTPYEIRTRPRSRYVGDLVGLNVLRGTAGADGFVSGDGMRLALAEALTGDLVVTFHPHAVSLHADRPSGSMRNVWESTLRHVEPYGDRVRVELGTPPGVAVEVTQAAASELGLEPGRRVWASLKATEIEAFPA